MFVKLTMPGSPLAHQHPLPIYVAIERIHSIYPRRVRADDRTRPATGPEGWKIEGSFVDTNGGEDAAFHVIEDAEDILRAIGIWAPNSNGLNAIEVEPRAEPATEFPEVFSADMDAAPHGSNLIGQLGDGTEVGMVWWHNWPGWREVKTYGDMGGPIDPIAWRRPTRAETDKFDDIPF